MATSAEKVPRIQYFMKLSEISFKSVLDGKIGIIGKNKVICHHLSHLITHRTQYITIKVSL